MRLAALLLAATLAGCAAGNVNPVTGKTIYPGVSAATEARYGEKLNVEMIAAYGLYAQPGLNAYVSRVGQALAQHTVRKGVSYTFTILDDEEINAFALPGGYVYVTRGALSFANNEAELAAILGHEIGHVDAFHFRGKERDTVSGVLSVLLKHSSKNADDLAMAQQLAEKATESTAYSQDQEFEADALGIHYMTLAGYDPQGMVGMLQAEHAKSELDDGGMKGNPVAHDIFALDESHPATPARESRALAAVQGEAAKNAAPAPGLAPKTDRDAYLAAIDGMTFGADPREGKVEGHRLVNAVQGYSFEAPDDFDLWTDRSGAFGVGRNAAMILETDQAPGAQSMVTYVETSISDEMPVANVRPLEIEGYRGATGTVAMDPFMIRVAAVRDGGTSNRLYKLMYVTPRRTFNELDQGFLESLKSFRPLEGAEAKPAPAPRLHVVTVARGDTVKSLAERMAVAEKKVEWFRVLNGLAASDELKPGDKVKLVE
ncbi:M48 family metalloprotease [Dongia sp. agr-C8]